MIGDRRQETRPLLPTGVPLRRNPFLFFIPSLKIQPSMLCPVQRSHASPGFSPRPGRCSRRTYSPSVRDRVSCLDAYTRKPPEIATPSRYHMVRVFFGEFRGTRLTAICPRSGAIAMRTVSRGISGSTSSWEFEGGTAEQLLSARKTRDVRLAGAVSSPS